MGSKLTRESISLFESIKQFDENGNEYWTSRDLSRILEYTDYRNFLKVVDKAKTACSNSNQQVFDHIVDFNDMIPIGKGGNRPAITIKLSRYACYLIVQNADPTKEIVAQGQTYFAIQTRIAEVQQMEAYQSLSTEEERRLFLREEMIKHNLLLGKAEANRTHYQVGAKVRQTIKELGGTMPEDLPVAESIKLVEKKKKKLDASNPELPEPEK